MENSLDSKKDVNSSSLSNKDLDGSRKVLSSTSKKRVKTFITTNKSKLLKDSKSSRISNGSGKRTNFSKVFSLAPSSSSASQLFLWFFLGLLIFSLYLLYLIASPFLHSIIIGCVLSALVYPVYIKILKSIKNPVFSAFIIILLMIVVVFIPITFFSISLIGQAEQSIDSVNSWLSGNDLGQIISVYVDPLMNDLKDTFPELDFSSIDIRGNIIALSSDVGQNLLGVGKFILSNAFSFFLHFGLVLLIMFFLLMDGVSLVNSLSYYFPLKPRQTNIIIEALRKISKSVLIGGFAVALLQGIAGGIGFAIAGIPAFFWGTVMVFAALVPVVGTGLVWVPAALVMLATHEYGKAVFLACWFIIIVASIDSFLRPFLMRDGIKVPVLFIFLSILGGITYFGMLGLLYGPMILTFAAVMLNIYSEEYDSILKTRIDEQLYKR